MQGHNANGFAFWLDIGFNVMNGIDYSSFISFGTMHLRPLINVFSHQFL